MKRYIITVAMPGYLPESDPYVFEADTDSHHIPQVLAYLIDEVDRMADDAVMGEADENAMERAGEPWTAVLDEIEEDRGNAADFSDDGFLYRLPNGYAIEATLATPSELVSLGYAPDIDDCPDTVFIDREGSSLDFDNPQWTPDTNEWPATAAAVNFRAAYGD